MRAIAKTVQLRRDLPPEHKLAAARTVLAISGGLLSLLGITLMAGSLFAVQAGVTGLPCCPLRPRLAAQAGGMARRGPRMASDAPPSSVAGRRRRPCPHRPG